MPRPRPPVNEVLMTIASAAALAVLHSVSIRILPIMPSHLINDDWLDGSGTDFHSLDPATNEVLAEYRAATATEVDQAVRAARAAFESWALLPVDARIAHLDAFGARLKQEKVSQTPGALPSLISRETGKPDWESLTELDAMINKIPLSIQAMRERRSPSEQTANNQTSATRYKPHGVIAVFGPFNFPAHLPNGHIVPALLAGNTVVFKPSELTPGVGRRMVELWQEAGLPAGVLNLVQGARETGQVLASHPEIDGLFFTGSVAAGRALNKLLADQPHKILALEMGGNNPLIVWDAASVDAAALLTIQSAYQTSGQRCSCARRLIVEEGPRGEALVQRLLELIPKIHVGPHTERPEPFMGPLVRPQAAHNAQAAQQRLIEMRATPLRPMKALSDGSAFVTPGLMDVTGIAVPDEEIFAPLLQVIRVSDFDTALAAANRTAFGLCAGLISNDHALYSRFFTRVRAGVINFNRPTTGASSALPFGGVGLSGNNRPSASHAADYCSYPIASLEQPAPVVPAALPPGIVL
jgi:succinylglutamic semialdehyde dehydrogenase